MPRVSLVCNLSSVLLSSYSFVLYSVFISLTLTLFFFLLRLTHHSRIRRQRACAGTGAARARRETEGATPVPCKGNCVRLFSFNDVCVLSTFPPRPPPLPRPLPPPPAAPPLRFKAEYSSVTVTPEYIRNSIPDNAATWLHAGLSS